MIEDLLRRAFLHQLAGVQHADPVAHLGIAARLCEMKSTAVPYSVRNDRTRSSTSASTVASSPVVGSSRINSLGSHANAMAMTTRCCIPPDSWCGYRLITESGSAICTLSRICPRPGGGLRLVEPDDGERLGSCGPTRIVGLSACPGSWYTMDRSWRARRATRSRSTTDVAASEVHTADRGCGRCAAGSE